MRMGPVYGTRGSRDTAKLQPMTSSTPCTQLSPTEPGEGGLGQPAWWGGVGPCPPLTADLAAVAEGLQRAPARHRWALPPRRPEQGRADAVSILKKSRTASVLCPSLSPPPRKIAMAAP